MITVHDNFLVLGTGKRVFIGQDVIGLRLDPKIDQRPVVYGYDGPIDWPMPGHWTDKDRREAKHYLTDDEMKELASHMVEAWTKFRDSL